LIDVVE
jgi:hypothetical protein